MRSDDGDATWVEANGLRIHVARLGGAAAEPLVLLHGRADSGPCWRRVALHLADRYHVLMPDARGHGSTEGPVEGATADTLVDDLRALLAALAVRAPILYGHSMGATTALLLAARHPAAARALVLEDPPFRDGPDERDLGERLAEAGIERRMPLDELVRAGAREHPAWTPEDLGPWAESKHQADPRVFAISWPTDWRWAVARARCPLLLLTGDPDRGAIVTPKVAADVEGSAPEARVVRVEGAGHSIHRDAFEPTVAAVDAFLAGLSPQEDPARADVR